MFIATNLAGNAFLAALRIRGAIAWASGILDRQCNLSHSKTLRLFYQQNTLVLSSVYILLIDTSN
jgi:hypothetical protein